jgi:hypothetical protein
VSVLINMRFFLVFLSLVIPSAVIASPQQRTLPDDVVAAIRQARTVVHNRGDKVWPGFSTAPFGFLYIEPDREVLLCDVRLPDGFRVAPTPNGLQCQQAVGPKSWRQPNLLAAMPAFGPPSVIVMGSPASTGRGKESWQATVFHKHFHQWQAELPNYYERVASLDLSGGDETGMWMLNFPFPYASSTVADAHKQASLALAAAIKSSRATLKPKARQYLAARARLEATVSDKEWRYLEFQLWQEGVARWTEVQMAELSGIARLEAIGREERRAVISALEQPNLSKDQRVAVYALGAGEAMLLDRTRPDWKSCYVKQLAMGPIFKWECRW